MPDIHEKAHLFALRGIVLSLLSWTIMVSSAAQTNAAADPTQPPPLQDPVALKRVLKPGIQWRLSAILNSGDRKVAIVNDRALLVGEKVNGAELISIATDRVVLKRGQRTIRLRLHQPKVGQKMNSESAQ